MSPLDMQANPIASITSALLVLFAASSASADETASANTGERRDVHVTRETPTSDSPSSPPPEDARSSTDPDAIAPASEGAATPHESSAHHDRSAPEPAAKSAIGAAPSDEAPVNATSTENTPPTTPIPIVRPVARDEREASKSAETASSSSGMIGTLSLSWPMLVGSTGSDVETRCSALGSNCSAENENGGGLMFSVGHAWKYIGFDVLGGVSLDGSTRRYVDAHGAPHSYAMVRFGGFAAARLRGTIQSDDFRVALAIGPGAAYRLVGKTNEYLSVPSDGNHYGSLAFTADVSVQWRMSRTTALALGALVWIEGAGDNVKMHETLPNGWMGAANGQLVGTSDRALVSGTQTMLLPYIGLQFGGQ